MVIAFTKTERLPQNAEILLLPSTVDNSDRLTIEHFSDNNLIQLYSFLGNRETIFLGHDRISGECSNTLAALATKKNIFSISCVFHHMNYKAYYEDKLIDDEPDMLLQKIKEQKLALGGADLVFAIGPKLLSSARAYKLKKDVYEFIPGLTSINTSNASDTRSSQLPVFNAITHGRVDEKNDKLKQYSLAVAAFGRTLKDHDTSNLFHADSKLRVVGVNSSATKTWLKEIAKTNYDRYNYCSFLKNINRDDILNYLMSDCHISLFLSTHEGFGLAGLDSIAAEVPIVLTKNSGIYDLLKRILKENIDRSIYPVVIKGQIDDGPNEDDITNIKNAIVAIRQDYSNYFKLIRLVKARFSRKYSWEKSIDSFFTIIETKVNNLKIRSTQSAPNVEESNKLAEKSSSAFKSGDIPGAYTFAQKALQKNPASTLAFYQFVRAAIRMDKIDILNEQISRFRSKSKDDLYYEAMMHYERAISMDYDKVLRYFNKIKTKNLQNYYDAGMCHFYSALRIKNLKRSNKDKFDAAIRKSLANLNIAKDMGIASKNKAHWWVDVMMLLIYKSLPDSFDRSDWRITEYEVLETLNIYIKHNPRKVSARIYRLFVLIIMNDSKIINKYITEDKNAIKVYKTLFLPLDLIDSVSIRILYLYEYQTRQLLKYNKLIENYIKMYKFKSL